MTPRARSRAARAVLKRITYKPGWEITLRGNRLKVAVPTFDAIGRRRKVMAGTVRYVSDVTLDRIAEGHEAITARFIEYVLAVIRLREFHEMDEWLKVDGRCVVDPHPELRP